MAVWLDVARVAAGVNVLVLAALGRVWFGNYRRHGASHTLALLVFASFLFVENVLWVVLYVLHEGFVGWFVAASVEVQVAMAFLCVLELVALAVLANVTLR